MSVPIDAPPVALNPTIDFVAGTIAGVASLVVGFPFDTVKVRFQSPEVAGKYRSTTHAIATIVREERVWGLYKGIASPLAAVALMNGLVFASYRFFLKLQLPTADTLPSLAQIAMAGAGCGIVSSLVTTPTELVKIRQQASLIPTTARAVARQIVRDAGVLGLYRGFCVTALRDCGYGAYFAAYEGTLRLLSTPGHPASDSVPALLIAGGVAGVAGWVATFPLDVIKTRIQGSTPVWVAVPVPAPSPSNLQVPVTHSVSALLHKAERAPLLVGSHTNVEVTSAGMGSTRQAVGLTRGVTQVAGIGPGSERVRMVDVNPYRTTWGTAVASYRAEGARVFWRGLAPTVLRAIPVNMATFATFEGVVTLLT